MRFLFSNFIIALIHIFGFLSAFVVSQKCNGYSELCSRPYNSVAFGATHNSFAVGDNNIAANQVNPITAQLDDGVRGFMLDLHKPIDASNPLNLNSIKTKRQAQTANIRLCHTTCLLLDAGAFVDTLATFKQYMDANTDQVITLFLENYDSFDSASIYSNFVAANLDSYLFNPTAYTTSSGFTWPTMSTILQSKKRLIVFSSPVSDTITYPTIMRQEDYVSQTPFDVMLGNAFTCNVTPAGRGLTIVNHFVSVSQTIGNGVYQVPNFNASVVVNTMDNIDSNVNSCKNGVPPIFPNFVAVDFYNTGGLFQSIAELNKLPFTSLTTNTFPKTSTKPSSAVSNRMISQIKLFIILSTVSLLF
ncbi:hypothetical protein BB558_003076 [Smittium angustum]|uniref:Phosphatidylinositol-specific phospholipase C X domain-containing protein n=1 Tax=Smittium angustum TaxID=133377 RepID=A0A2U1J6Y3_SMIAN|nr:hypothetical protein BB558_003076 [Smittium angustum]